MQSEDTCAPLEPGRCPVEVTLEIIGGKWKPLLLYYLLDGTKRFNQLRRLLPQVTQQMLTLQLRELERDGIVHRKVYAEVPPKVEYSLSEAGRSLEPILLQMLAWGQTHLAQRAQAAEQAHPSTRDEAA
jgi:DNA-binding HxlR family transcriptional regulator